MGIPDHPTCLLRNLYAGQKAIIRTRHGTMDWFQIGKGVRQGYILSACLLNFYTEYIMGNGRLDEAWAGIKIARRNSNNLRYAAAAATKLLQSCPTLCDPIDGIPPGSPVPGILQARTLEWVAISFSNAWKWKVKVKSLSHVWLLVTPWTAAYQAPPSLGYADDTNLLAENEELKSLLMKVKEFKVWLKTQHSKNEDRGIWSHLFMAN